MATNYANWGQVPAKKKQPGVNIGGSVGSIVQSGAQTVKKAGITNPVQKVVGSGSGAATTAATQPGGSAGIAPVPPGALSNLGPAPAAAANPVVPGPAGSGAAVPIGGGSVVAQSTGTGGNDFGDTTGGLGGNYNHGGDPYTGFAGQYAPGGVGQLLSNPQLLGNDVLKSMGLGNSTSLQSQIGDLSSIAPALSFIMRSMSGDNAMGDEANINTQAGLLKSMMTAGGNGLDYRDLLNDIGDPNNAAMRDYLTKGPADASGNATPLSFANQANLLQGLVSAAIGGMDPYFQRAFMGRLGSGLQDYQSGLSKGQDPSGSALDYLRSHGMLGGF